MGKYFSISGNDPIRAKLALILPRLTSVRPLGDLGSYELKSHPGESSDVDDGADFDRAIVEIDCVVRLGKIDRDGYAGADDDLALLNVQGPTLERARRPEDRGDEPPTAGNGVDLARLGAQPGVDGLPDRPGVGAAGLKIEAIVCVERLKDDERIFCLDHFPAR